MEMDTANQQKSWHENKPYHHINEKIYHKANLLVNRVKKLRKQGQGDHEMKLYLEKDWKSSYPLVISRVLNKLNWGQTIENI